MPGLNYAKWDNIDVSDDEDDTHPNVDTPSLFRWRHKARIEREGALRKERFEVDREGDRLRRKEKKLKSKIADEIGSTEMVELEAEKSAWREKEASLVKREQAQAWNVDTLSTEKASKTIINKPRPVYKHYDSMTDTEKTTHFEKHHKNDEFKKRIKTYGMTPTSQASQAFLAKNTDVVCDFTAILLTSWCVDLAQEGKQDLSDIVAHQMISMQFILELAKHTKRHPADCFAPFYKKRLSCEREKEAGNMNDEVREHHEAFNDELKAFKGRVQIRVEQRKEEAAQKAKDEAAQKAKEEAAQKAQEEAAAKAKEEAAQKVTDFMNQEQVTTELVDWTPNEEKKATVLTKEDRINRSPGGIDPIQVFKGLPAELRECFLTKDLDKLQNLINDDFPKYAESMRKCVLSGLWVPTKDSPLYVFLDPESGIDPHAELQVVENLAEDGATDVKVLTKGIEGMDFKKTHLVRIDDEEREKISEGFERAVAAADAAKAGTVEVEPAEATSESATRWYTSLDEVD